MSEKKYLFEVEIKHKCTVLLDSDDPDYAMEEAAEYLSDISSAQWTASKVKELDLDDPEIKNYI